MAVEPAGASLGEDESPVAEPAVPRARTDGAPHASLSALGLSRPAERVYRALVAHGAATPARLANLLGADAVTVRAALDELAGLDLARPEPDGERWSAAPPDVALAALVVRNQQVLLQRQSEIDRASAAIGELARIAAAGRGTAGAESVEVVHGRHRLVHRTYQLARTARTTVSVLDRTTYGIWPTVGSDAAAVTEPADALVAVRVVYDRDALLGSGRFDDVRRRAVAEPPRILPGLPLSVVTVDDAAAVAYLDEDEHEPTGLVLGHSPVLSALLLLVDLLWDRAVPIGTVADPIAPRSAEFDEALVALLAAGFKDESIARQLGVSTSTVTRRMARLMELTGTSTRFQLGMQAVRRGWV